MTIKRPVSEVLEERGAQYGDWVRLAGVTQRMRSALRSGEGWDHLSVGEREALDGAVLKLARIVNAGANVSRDSWDDAIGYLTLGRDRG